MRAFLCVSVAALVAGCGSSGGSSGDQTGDASSDESGDSASIDTANGETPPPDDTNFPTCPKSERIVLTGTPTPGATVTLSVSPPYPYSTGWSVTKGTLSPDTGNTVKWTLPTDVATTMAETLTATAAFDGKGICVTAPVMLDVVVDWLDASRTVVVYDSARTGSKDVADAYASYRSIPADHLCAVTTADAVSISSTDYATFVDAVMACVTKIGPWIHFIVPVWGVPYKVSGQVSDLGDPTKIAEVSLDALLVFGSASKKITAPTINPFFQGSDPYGGTDSLKDRYKP